MVKIEFEEPAASNSGSNSRKCLWLAFICGAFGNFALWHARGSDPIKYCKFAVTNFLAVSTGAGATYSAMFFIVPASYDHCIDPAQEADFELYRGWFRDHHQTAFLNGTPPSPSPSPTGPTAATRKKRSISSAVSRTSPATMMSSVVDRTTPATTSEATSAVASSYSPDTPTGQSGESNYNYKHNVDISINKAYSPFDARHLKVVLATGALVLYGNLAQLALLAVVIVTIYDYGLRKAAINRALALEDSRSTEMSTNFGRWDESIIGSTDANIGDTGIYMECSTTPTFLRKHHANLRNTAV